LAVDLIDKGNEILKSADKFPVPLLLLQGTEDKLVDPKATAQFAAHLNQNGTYKPIEGGYHELHNEPYKEEIFNIILQWINDRLNEPKKENA
jgi:alpha-beta hydrolase superfamily lysophospholipase